MIHFKASYFWLVDLNLYPFNIVPGKFSFIYRDNCEENEMFRMRIVTLPSVDVGSMIKHTLNPFRRHLVQEIIMNGYYVGHVALQRKYSRRCERGTSYIYFFIHFQWIIPLNIDRSSSKRPRGDISQCVKLGA